MIRRTYTCVAVLIVVALAAGACAKKKVRHTAAAAPPHPRPPQRPAAASAAAATARTASRRRRPRRKCSGARRSISSMPKSRWPTRSSHTTPLISTTTARTALPEEHGVDEALADDEGDGRGARGHRAAPTNTTWRSASVVRPRSATTSSAWGLRPSASPSSARERSSRSARRKRGLLAAEPARPLHHHGQIGGRGSRIRRLAATDEPSGPSSQSVWSALIAANASLRQCARRPRGSSAAMIGRPTTM